MGLPNNIQRLDFEATEIIEKSEELITAFYENKSINEQKVLLFAMAAYPKQKDSKHPLTFQFIGSELAEQLGLSKDNIARDLLRLAVSMNGKQRIMFDKETGNFRVITPVPTCNYSNGIFTIELHQDMKKQIGNGEIDPEKVQMLLTNTKSLRRQFSLRLYDMFLLLRKKAKNIDSNGVAEVCIDMQDLQSKIGLCKFDKMTSYKEAPQVIETHYKYYSQLNTYVLQPSVQEINEHTELHVEYEPIKAKGMDTKIIFKISINESTEYNVYSVIDDLKKEEQNDDSENKPEIQDVVVTPKNSIDITKSSSIDNSVSIDQTANNSLFDMVDEVRSIMPGISTSGAVDLLQASDYNIKIIKMAIKSCNMQRISLNVENILKMILE